MATNPVRKILRCGAPLLAVLAIVGLAGCGSTQAAKGGTGGAAIGAVASGVLGGNMVTGALVGGGLGYIMGNEADKRAAQQQAEAERARAAASRVTADQSTAYQPEKMNPLVGSSWQLIAYETDGETPEWSGAVLTFATNSKATTLIVFPDGETESFVESYRVVDDVLILSGTENGQDYAVPMTMSIADGQMVLVASDFRAVLKELEETA